MARICCEGVRASRTSAVRQRSLTVDTKVFDDLEIDVGFEESEADFAEGLVDDLLGESGPAFEAFEYGC